jgi:hypothetical protein
MTVFKTDDGDFDVSKMSLQNQHIFVLAQKLVTDIKSLSDDIESKKAALEWFKAQLGTECNESTIIRKGVDIPSKKRARDADGKFVADDPSTPDVNEAYVQRDQED